MGVVYFSIIPTFEPSRYYKCWIVCFYYILNQLETEQAIKIQFILKILIEICDAM